MYSEHTPKVLVAAANGLIGQGRRLADMILA